MNHDKNLAPHLPISVVIPCYKCKNTIENTINSVANQTVLPSEIICIDDCGNDGSLELLYDLQKRYVKEWIKIIKLEKNSGPSIARNIGWNQARGDYIAFLDADDIWHPKKLEIQYQYMKDNSDIILSGHGCPLFKDQFIEIPKVIKTYQVNKLKLIISNRFITPTAMLKKDLPYRFSENKDYAEDYLLWLQIVTSGYKSGYIDAPLAYILKAPYGAGGLTSNLSKLDQGIRDSFWKLYQEKRIGIFTALFLQLYAKLKHYRRVLKVRFKKLSLIFSKNIIS